MRLRDKYTCRICGAKQSNIVDHIVSVAGGGSWELGNLQVLCQPCSDLKTRQETYRGRQRSTA
ncbi:HNH endonuclease signature motif containing protein [Streptosporangium sp. NPDC020072]|uniref:HNH endonuclease n=1 Tax=Streptosporangium sp. NPDC020072 TaxID=3154788 RepID=UPI00344499D5